MTYTPDEDFADFLTKFGQPFAAKAADEAVLQKYRGILPDQLLTYWRQYGFCGFADGLFWITNPDDYEDILPDWLPETEQVRHKHYVIARTGWGELLVWEPAYGHKYTVNPHFGFVGMEEDVSREIAKGRGDQEMRLFFSLQKPKYFDRADHKNRPLFQRAVKKLGALADDEMFYFSPALVVGDHNDLAHVEKGNLFAQLDILRGLVELQVLDPI